MFITVEHFLEQFWADRAMSLGCNKVAGSHQQTIELRDTRLVLWIRFHEQPKIALKNELLNYFSQSVEGEHHEKAVELLKAAKESVKLVVRYTPKVLEEMEARFEKLRTARRRPAAAAPHAATAAAKPGHPAEPHVVGEAFHCFKGIRTSAGQLTERLAAPSPLEACGRYSTTCCLSPVELCSENRPLLCLELSCYVMMSNNESIEAAGKQCWWHHRLSSISGICLYIRQLSRYWRIT